MSYLERLARTNHSMRASGGRPPMKPRPLQISDDGHDRSLFSRQRDIIMNQVLSPTIRTFSFDGGSSLPFKRKSPSLRTPSPDSIGSVESVENVWDRATLLDMTDSVRQSLEHRNNPGPKEKEKELANFLETALKDEDRSSPSLDFATLKHARLDKLLADLLAIADSPRHSTHDSEPWPEFRIDVSNANNLRRAWRRRFREDYIMIDHHRSAELLEDKLKHINYMDSPEDEPGKWHIEALGPVSELEGNLQFNPGHWWLHITCAEKDGVVASSLEKPTKGRYGPLVLPLLTGEEKLIRKGTSKYIRFGRPSDMHIPLISQVGRQIRLLRGHALKSAWAPQAGVRYDGLYTIIQYGTKLDDETETHRLELTLERVAGQKSMGNFIHIPKPSQLDDWHLFQKLEGDKIKQTQGETGYLEWKLRKQNEKDDREDWKRSLLFAADESKYQFT